MQPFQDTLALALNKNGAVSSHLVNNIVRNLVDDFSMQSI
jgi:hypothetical protein